jgi:ribosomal protein S12 methylthiotransferase
MEKAAAISSRRLAARVGTRVRVLIDEVVDGVALARSAAEAPQIDGVVRIGSGKQNSAQLDIGEKNITRLTAGEWAEVQITGADAYDLTGRVC